MKFFLPSAQSMKVFCYLSNFVYKHLEKYMVRGLTMHRAIKENSRVDWLGGGSVCKVKLSSFFSANCLSSWKGTCFAFFTFIFTKTSTQMSLYHISLRWLSLVALFEFNLSCLPYLAWLPLWSSSNILSSSNIVFILRLPWALPYRVSRPYPTLGLSRLVDKDDSVRKYLASSLAYRRHCLLLFLFIKLVSLLSQRPPVVVQGLPWRYCRFGSKITQ